MSSKIIDVTLKLVDNLTKPLGSATTALTQSAKKYQRLGKEITSVGKSFTSVGTSLTKSVTTPILALGAAAVSVASDFETSMDQVAAVLGDSATSEDIEELTEKAEEMGAQMKYSASDSADAFLLLAQAGWDTSEMMDNIEGMMYFAGATSIDLADAANYVVSAMSGLGEESGYTAEIIGNNLAVAATSSKTDADSMGEAFSNVATTVGQMGYSMEDACVILGTLANANVEGSEAGMAFNRIIERMSTNSTAISELDALGVSMYDANGNARDLTDVFDDLRQAYSDLGSDAERTAAAKALGGQYSTKLKAILGSEESTWQDLKDAMEDTSGATTEMYEEANDNLSGQLTILKSTVESIGIALGDKLLPKIKQGVTWFQSLADKINNLSDAQIDNIIKWAEIAAVVGPTLLIFGKTVVGVGNVIKTFGDLGDAIKKAKGLTNFLTSPSALIVAGFAALVVAGILVYKNWDKIKAAAKKLSNGFKDLTKWVKSHKTEMALLGVAFGTITALVIAYNAATIASTASVIAHTVATKASALGQGIMTAATTAWTAVCGIATGATTALGAAVTFLTSPIALVIIGIGAAIAIGILLYKNWDTVTKYAKKFGNAIKTQFSKIGTQVKKIGNGFTAFKNKVSASFSAVKSAVSTKLNSAFTKATTIVNKFKKQGAKSMDGFKEACTGVNEFVSGVFTGDWDAAWTGIKDIFKGISDALPDCIKTPLNSIISFINKAINGINNAFSGISIPDWVPEIGGNTYDINIPTIPALAKGTDNWKGGIVQVSEKGGEIIDLPNGSRVYPHDESVKKAKADGSKTINVTVENLCKNLTVRSQDDIDQIAKLFAEKLVETAEKVGGGTIGDLA